MSFWRFFWFCCLMLGALCWLLLYFFFFAFEILWMVVMAVLCVKEDVSVQLMVYGVDIDCRP